MAEKKATDAATVISLIREYAKASMASIFWKDVVECAYDEKSGTWRVVFEASPSFSAPYYKYEAMVDAESGDIRSVKRLE